jgi:CheY-like chemotaxis protein
VIASNLKNPLPSGTEKGWLGELPEAYCASPRTFGVLVADDEACIRGVMNVAMRQQGFAVWLAANGQEAIDLYRLHHETIDVILLDVLMPGLDGPRTLAALQALNPWIRCCFMSGDLGSYTAETLENLGAAALLRKPFRLAEAARVLCEQASKASRDTAQPLSVH